MDIISVTEASLLSVRTVVLEMRDKFDESSKRSIVAITDLLNRIDESFQPKITSFVDSVEQLNRDIIYCLDEHNTAINDRLNRFPEYESKKYIRR